MTANTGFMSTTINTESPQAVHAKQAADAQAAQDAAAPKWSSTAVIHNTVTRSTFAAGNRDETVTPDTQQVTNGDDRGAVDAGGQLIARNANGRTLSSAEVRPDSIITIAGIDTSIRAALAAGLIAETATGYAPVGEALGTGNDDSNTGNNPNKPANDAPVAIEALDAESEALISNVVSKVTDGDRASGVRTMIDNGVLTQDITNRMATQLGMTPQQVTEKAAQLDRAFRDQAAKVVGSNSEAVFQWARNNAANDLKMAVLSHVNDGSTAGYKELATRYTESIPEHSPQLLNAAIGMGLVNRERDGTFTVNHPKSGRVSWKVALRTGLIKV